MSSTNDSRIAAAAMTIAVLAVLLVMRAAHEIVVPVLAAFFLAVVAESVVAGLIGKGVSRTVAVLLVVIGIAAAFFGLGLVLGTSIQDLSAKAPEYQERLQSTIDSFFASGLGSRLGTDAAGIVDKINPDAAFGLASGILTGVSDLFSKTFLVLFLMILMLLELPSLAAKIQTIIGSGHAWGSIGKSVRGYLGIKTLTSLATGVLAGILLAIVGVDFAVLWGLLAFLLNYVPTIGSILAAVPPILLALLLNGPVSALIVAAGFAVINVVMGSVLEPRIMGKGLGLSTLVVFLSVILWGWLLGPAGMLLAIPLTTTLKIVFESHERTRPLALLLGTGRAVSGA